MIGPEFPEEVPSRVPERTLREFSALCLAIFGGLFALSWHRHQGAPNAAGWVAGGLAVLVGLPGVIWPNSIRAVYLAAMALTKPIGHVVGLVLLAIVFYGVMTPLAIVFRFVGRNSLARRSSQRSSYWVDRVRSSDVRLYLRQYQAQSSVDRAPAAETRSTTIVPVPLRLPPTTTEIPALSNAQPLALSGANHGKA